MPQTKTNTPLIGTAPRPTTHTATRPHTGRSLPLPSKLKQIAPSAHRAVPYLVSAHSLHGDPRSHWRPLIALAISVRIDRVQPAFPPSMSNTVRNKAIGGRSTRAANNTGKRRSPRRHLRPDLALVMSAVSLQRFSVPLYAQPAGQPGQPHSRSSRERERRRERRRDRPDRAVRRWLCSGGGGGGDVRLCGAGGGW